MRFPSRPPGALLCALLPLLVLPGSAETLRGRILDRASLAASPAGKGVPAARLIIYGADGKRRAAKASGRNGAYAFPALVPGAYTLTVSRAGYLPRLLVRSVVVGEDDTLARDFSLDRLPVRGGIPFQSASPA